MSWSATHQPPKSRLIGPARQANEQPTIAFEALIAQTCGQCGATIALGHLVVRHALVGHLARVRTMAQAPICTTCRPLHLET